MASVMRSNSILRSVLTVPTSGAAFARSISAVGEGGRSSASGLKVAVFGATGFLGRYVCNELGECGSTAYIANRGCEMETRHLRLMFDLGNAAYYFYEPKDEESIAKVVEGADVVINMVGKRYATKHAVPFNTETGKVDFFRGSRVNNTLMDSNCVTAATLAKVVSETPSVKKFVHLSCLGASPDSSSELLRSKFASEEAVKSFLPHATIVRPSIMFGHEDKFLNWYAWMNKRFRIPLCEDGAALVQPVWVADVARAVMTIAEEDPLEDESKFEGKTVELAGPAEYSRAEIAEFVQDITKIAKGAVPVPKAVLSAVGDVIDRTIAEPFLTKDDVEIMSTNFICDVEQAKAAGVLTMEDFDIEPTPVEKVAFQYLHRYRQGGRFVYAAGYH